MKTCFYLIILNSMLLVQGTLHAMDGMDGKEKITNQVKKTYSQLIQKSIQDTGTSCCIITPFVSTVAITSATATYKLCPNVCLANGYSSQACVFTGCAAGILTSIACATCLNVQKSRHQSKSRK
jgi:hypothetical protein